MFHRSFPGSGPRRRYLGLALAVVLSTLLGGVQVASVGHAAAARTQAAIHSLALPPAVFGSGVSLSSGVASDGKADTASGLHTTSFFKLDRSSGYLQTAGWNVPAGHVTLRYLANVYPSLMSAATAYADARVSLWEAGLPADVSGISTPAFRVEERSGYTDVVAIILEHTVEDELILHYPTKMAQASVAPAMTRLRLAWKQALRRARRFPQTGYFRPEVIDPLPPIAVAPWGTGPVVESPSLLLIDTDMVAPDTRLDPVVERGQKAARLMAPATRHATLAPTGALSRFARTASMGGGSLYDTATLYSNPAAASDAFATLIQTNRARNWIHPLTVDPAGMRGVDAAQGWSLNRELIVAIQVQNTVMVLASTGHPLTDLVQFAGQAALLAPTWLHAQGTEIVNGDDQPVRLTGLNWYGAEENDFVVGGLSYRPYQSILQTIRALDYNTIRLPFSNQLVEQNPVVTSYLDANPDLAGLHALDVLDRIINYAGALGMHVILDDHRSDAGWGAQETGLWYTKQYPESAFVQDWATLAGRYAVNNVVIGADLRNEPHARASWGDGNPATDWRLAAQKAGNAVLAVNPRLLILVEGVQYSGNASSYWWGGNLMGVAAAPVELQFADGTLAHSQLVYSPHDYGPDNCGGGCPWFNGSSTYQSLSQVWDQYWGYITANDTAPYAAPVWLGEFGTCNYQSICGLDSTPGSQGQWFSSLVQYIQDKNLGWAYWSLNGSQSTGGTRVYGYLDWYGYFNQIWVSPYPWLDRLLRGIQGGAPGDDPSHPTGPR